MSTEHDHEPVDHDSTTLWVITEPDEHGEYRAVVQYNPDTVYAMDRDMCRGYAEVLVSAAAAAKHYSAVLRQLTEVLGLPREQAAEVIGRLRHERGREEWTAGPLTLLPAVARHRVSGRFYPIVQSKAGRTEWTWDPESIIGHANHVLMLGGLAEYESRYLRFLGTILGDDADLTTRMAAVQDLSRFMHDDDGQQDGDRDD
jgi:hypothetical protein